MGVVLILVRKEMEQINGIVSKEYVEGIKKLGISFLSNLEGASEQIDRANTVIAHLI